jgi:hypothetical protein
MTFHMDCMQLGYIKIGWLSLKSSQGAILLGQIDLTHQQM